MNFFISIGGMSLNAWQKKSLCPAPHNAHFSSCLWAENFEVVGDGIHEVVADGICEVIPIEKPLTLSVLL